MKTALVTGASSGIGRATALAFDKMGIQLILCGRRIEKLQELQSKLNVKSTILTFDVSNKEEVINAIDSIPEDFEKIDILVNNAGNAHGFGSLADGETEDWDAMLGSNVNGLLYVSKAVIPSMIQNGGGHVINISSVAGKQTYANGTVYCATKKAVEAISEGIRLDHTKDGIKVTNIAPGAVETEFSEVRFKGDKERAKKVYEGFEPLTATDIADAIAYAVSVPDHVTIADMTIYAKAQAAPTTVYRST
ncbi:SDR family NAD(P)-dependent oxidoreductase [Jiulongibacter sediminis]|uniref:Malonic semialdehyde reductase n=1 Tax=Jiulongibacter sediminis TaxID=1605367 RepID=A0A0P7BEI2_9BACT|nr:SDR family NAD(P)-dependent oxidoreductase [Jiulongibacter sediminis]KPM49179.1 malonic semialdehyde reductase [Jiulongibacter sediminis]TBX26233.1 malonic semialdehyde reductase [Jiulongibacter sediminis]